MLALLDDLTAAGDAVAPAPRTRAASRSTCSRPARTTASSRSAHYEALLSRLPPRSRRGRTKPGAGLKDDTDLRDGAFCFRAQKFGNVISSLLPPYRGAPGSLRRLRRSAPSAPQRRLDRLWRSTWGASTRSPTWAQMVRSNGCPARRSRHVEASRNSSTGGAARRLSLYRQQSGEAAQAKRCWRVTVGDLPPRLNRAAGFRAMRASSKRLIDEQCAGRRARTRPAQRLAKPYRRDRATYALAREPASPPRTRLMTRSDESMPGRVAERPRHQKRLAYFRRTPADAPDAQWSASADAERRRCSRRSTAAASRRARRGADAGGATCLPTGRNLFTADPRTLPTPTAMELGRLAATEVVRAHCRRTASGRAPS